MVVPIKPNPPKAKMDKQEFIGNCKEFRIETNKNHLRIVGNGNKIRVNNNKGHLEVIGNATRLKVVNNSGKISYTGNNGKVYLGKDSSVKDVNYIGNNGILKLVSSAQLHSKGSSYCRECKGRSTDATRSKRSSDSPTGSDCDEKFFGFGSFDESNSKEFQRPKIHSRKDKSERICLYVKNNISMPNLDAIGCGAHISNSIKIACSTGNIVVNNNIQF